MADAKSLMRPVVQLYEGCHTKARWAKVPEYEVYVPYLCPANVWTCGWGSTGPDVKPGVVWTPAYCDQRLDQDLDRFLAGTLQLVPGLSGARLAALADFSYNLGLGRLKASTLRKRALAGNWDAVCVELQKWVFGGGKQLPGLVARRKVEVALIRSTM